MHPSLVEMTLMLCYHGFRKESPAIFRTNRVIPSCTVWSQGIYQLHKCSRYCKRRRKCGNTYITRCRFGFPPQPCETAKLNPVSESLKSRSRIYQLTRSESETRVNDYNPLLILLWKANIDIQFVAESSLALAHYVSQWLCY